MIKKYKLRLIVFLICCFYSTILSAQINTPSGAVVPFGANPNYGANHGIMPANLPTGGTYGKSQDAADAYNEWKANYTESCGGGQIRVRFDEPNRTVSEGISYGMLLSAYAADKALFDGLWAYYKAHANGNGFMNWRIDGCSGTSGNNGATDADMDAAFALLIAENQWPSLNSPYDYATEANNLLNKIKQYELNSAGQAINGDGWGFGDPCRNPSYQSPAYYREFAIKNTANTGAWNSAVGGAYTLLNSNAHATTGLVSDWSDPNGVRNTCNPGGLGYAATNGYGYDACRNPWRMAQDVIWNGNSTATQAQAICNKIATYVNGKGAGSVGGPLNQDGSNYSGFAHNATFVSTFAMGIMGSSNQTLMDAMYTQTKNTKDPIKNSTLSGYFGNTLRCVSLFMMTGNFWKLGTTSDKEINVKVGTINVPSATTYDFLNVQSLAGNASATGKSVVFTIENLGFANLVLGPAPIVTVTGGAGFSVTTQPSTTTLALNTSTTFTVLFKPATNGIQTAVLTIKSNDADEGSYTINLTGNGTPNTTAAKMTVYDTTNVLANGAAFPMGTFTSGSQGYKLLKITNTGDNSLSITGASFGNAAFTLLAPLPLPISIPIGATKYVTIGFTAPATAGTTNSTLTLTTTDPNNLSFVLNLSATSAACSANPGSKIIMDYDGNKNVIQPFVPHGTWSPTAANPAQTGLNLSPTVASYVRPATGTTVPTVWNGDYDIIRYYNCGTVGTTYVPFAVSAANPTIQVLVYSPAVGITIVLAPQMPDPATPGNWLPLIADYSSQVIKTTTKANQWELITFDMGKIIAAGVTANFKALDIQIDPLRAYASQAANASVAARTFYIDEIKYGNNPCLTDNSGILLDFDNHNNMSLDYAVSALSAPVLNSVSGGQNTSPNVGQFIKTKNAAAFDDGFRYDGCSNQIDFSTKKYLSMLVYSPVSGANIQVSAKVPDNTILPADADAYPDDAAFSTQQTVFAGRWDRLYFDLSGIAAANLNKVFAIDIFFDPSDVTAGGTYYFDDIRLESTLPCVSGIPATNILNDFDNNRYLSINFPGAPAFNSIKANPSSGGINTSATVGEFVRGTLTTGTSVRFNTCQNVLDMTPGHALIDLKVLSPNAGVVITMSLKNSLGVSVSDVSQTVATANTWTNLRFDHSNILNSTAVYYIDVIVDPAGTFSGAATTPAQRTYEFDDLMYSPSAPEINVKALTSPTYTDVLTTQQFTMGTIAVGDSSTTNFSIQNNGLQTLTLTGTGAASLVKGGANPGDFIITTTQTFSTSIGALGATGFTVQFKPTSAGAKSASITITSNDSDEGTYVIYLNGTATASIISVAQGATAYPSNGTAYDFGNVVQATASAPVTFTIKNTGNAALNLTNLPLTATGDFQITTQPISPVSAPTGTTTFIVTFTPTALGVRTGTITIASNDPATPSYVLKLTGTGIVPPAPEINVKVGTTDYLTASTYSFGTVNVGTATPATTFTIENTGNAVLNLTGTPKIAISGTNATDFTVTQTTTTATVAAAATTTFTVSLNATAAGARTAILTIANDYSNEGSYVINLSATAVAPEINVKVGTTNYLTSTTYSFGAVIVGTATPAVTFTIENLGTAALNLTGTPIVVKSGTNAADYTVTQTTTTASVAAAASTTFTVTLNASAAGTRTAILTIATNDSDEGSYVINLSATATAVPEINVKVGTTSYATASSYDFGTVTVGTATPATTFTIENLGSGVLNLTGTPIVLKGGTNAADFTVTQTTTTATVAAAATTTFTVSLNASATGTRTATLTIANNDSDEGNYVINLTANASAALVPEINVKSAGVNTPSAGTYNFGAVTTGVATAATTFTIENIGTAALTLTGTPKVVLAGTNASDFTLVQTGVTGSIAAGANNTFTVSLNASAVGTRTATLTIANNDSDEGSYVINLTATASAPLVPEVNVKAAGVTTLTGGTYNFGSVTVGTATAATTFTIENLGTAALTLTGTPKVVLAGTNAADFTLVQTGVAGSIAAASSNTFTVSLNASAVGTRTATLTIASNDSDEASYVLNLTASASAAPVPEINVKAAGVTTLTGGSYNFGSVTVGTATAATTFTIENLGTAALTLTGTPKVVLGGANAADFTLVQTAVTGSIAAASSNTFTVSLNASAVGTRTATLTIASNDSDEASYVINLTATASAAPVPEINVKAAGVTTLTGGTYNFGTVVIGTATAATTFTIENLGTAALTLTGTPKVVLGGANAADFTLVQTGVTGSIAAASSNTFTVSLNASAAGTRTATLTIASNDSDEASYVINLTATASTATGITNSLSNDAIDIYPNPSNGSMFIEFRGSYDKVEITVYNALGYKVYFDSASSINSNELPLLVGGLPAGVYFVEINTAQGKAVKRIVKE